MQSVGAIASGNISAAVAGVESSLAKSIPIALSFMSKIFKVSGIGSKVKAIINKVKGRIEQVVSRVMDKAAALVAKVVGKPATNQSFNKKPLDDTKDTSSSTQVKQKAGTFLRSSIPDEFTKPEEITSPSQKTLTKFRKDGLKSVKIKNKGQAFELYVKASPEERVALTKAKLQFSVAELKAMPFGTVTLHATVNGKHVGSFDSQDGTHAEQSFIQFMNQNWDRFSGNEKMQITIQITSSMCGVDEGDKKCRDCAGNLSSWAALKGVKLTVDILGIYKGATNKNSVEALRKIYEGNGEITLRAWEETEIQSQIKELYGDSIPKKVQNRILSKARNAKKTLEKISGKELS